MNKTFYRNGLALALAAAFGSAAAAGAPAAPLTDWPRIKSAVRPDPKLEAQVARIVAGMTLAQKIGQMTQSEIKTTTPEQVRQFHLGSVLNGGGSWPNGNKHASAADWVALADRYYDASMATDLPVKVPVIWGIDAIHGNSNVFGATQFPHNIGLGAANNPQLVYRIGQAVGKAVRATGINWVFAPTLAVVRDDRWGRTYEGFSENPALVARYGDAYVRGLQGNLKGDASVVATAKHYLGDGGTHEGKDQGVTRVPLSDMINIHARGYYTALAAGAQTVMASYNSWVDTASGKDYGKMHGSHELLTVALKQKMGFDGFVVSDWNAIGQLPGCTNASCPAAINAGVDMIMVPDDWQQFIANTVKQVESGEIPMARIDDAVSRIVRVKLRAALAKPSANPYAGKQEALQARALARQAVRESLVLLKNDGGALPLRRGQKILVVGKNADNLPNQTGGWTLTWQGTDNKNSDFPVADSILAGIAGAAGKDKVAYSVDASGVDVSQFDVVVAVIGETPYAEMAGDIGPSGTLRHTGRHPEDLAVLKAVAGKGKPVVTVLTAGRPVWANDLLNLSDSFVMAWLPGTEGKGVADVLFRRGGARFTGTLPFSWPKAVCQAPLNHGDKDYAPLFALGYGLKFGDKARVGQLDASYPAGGCGVTNVYPVFNQSDRATWPLYVHSAGERSALGADLNRVLVLPNVKVETTQVNTQQDGKLLTFTGPAALEARGAVAALPSFATTDGALVFDTIVSRAPAAPVTVAIGPARVDVTAALARLAGKGKQTVKVPLACFTAAGADLARVEMPFALASEGAFTAAVANIQVVGGAARDPDATGCGGAQ